MLAPDINLRITHAISLGYRGNWEPISVLEYSNEMLVRKTFFLQDYSFLSGNLYA
jgi:hypothetical protein